MLQGEHLQICNLYNALKKHVKIYQIKRSLRSSGRTALTVPSTCLRTERDRSFAVRAPHLRNDLPEESPASFHHYQITVKASFYRKACVYNSVSPFIAEEFYLISLSVLLHPLHFWLRFVVVTVLIGLFLTSFSLTA